jgi:hypothetical protein
MIPDPNSRLFQRLRKPSLGLGLNLSLSGSGSAFNPATLFGASDSGFLASFLDINNVRQDGNGITAGAVASPIGLLFDESKALLVGAEKIVNGDFSSGTGWSVSTTNTVISGGKCTLTAGLTGFVNRTDTSLVAGTLYQIQFTISNYVAGTVKPYLQGAVVLGVDVSANGTFTQYILANTTSATSQAGLWFTSTFTGELDDFSVKPVAGNHAQQVTGSLKTTLRQSGAYYMNGDGSDDNLLGTAVAGAANTIAARLTVPASIAATQAIMGEQASTSTRLFLALNTSGNICGGVGSDSTATILGSADLRGTTGVAVLVADGTTVTLYWNGAVAYTGAQNGNPSTTIPFRYGALNNNGTAANFCPADIYKLFSINRALTATEIARLSATWR